MPVGDYLSYQSVNQAVGGTITVNTTGSSGTNIISGGTGTASGAIFVQRLSVTPTTGSTGVTWSFVDSSGSTSITGLLPMDVAPGPYQLDYGPRGVQLPTGASLQLVLSATGAAGIITWEGYKKYMGGTSVGFFPASGSSGSIP